MRNVDDRTVDTLVREVAPEVSAYCRRRVRHLADPALSVEDVVQEALAAVATALRTRGCARSELVAYSIGIARHKVVDAYRSSGGHRDVRSGADLGEWDMADPEPGPEIRAEQAELAALARRLLSRLPEHQATVLRLRILDGLSAAETAERIGSTPGAVRVTQHRALTALRTMLPPAGPTGPVSPD